MYKKFNGCPIAKSLKIFGDKWSLIILRDVLFDKKRHFHEFIQSSEKISSNILANRLKNLQAMKLLESKIDCNNKRVKVYTATEKAKDLEPLLIEMSKWGSKYDIY
jgi:DNA-binding HxlR family transcriptional regulator